MFTHENKAVFNFYCTPCAYSTMIIKPIILIFILLCSFSSFSAQQDTLRLFYPIGNYQILKHKSTLDSLLKTRQEFKQLTITGYADYLGSTAFNSVLSLKRAQTVKGYLVQTLKDIPVNVEAKGEISSVKKAQSALGEPFNRRVEIVFNNINSQATADTLVSNSVKPVDRPKPVTPPDFTADTGDVQTRLDKLPGLQVGESLSFKELTFQPGRHFLNRKAVPYLQSLLNILKKNKNLQIEIQGHICCDYQNRDGYDFDTKEYSLSVNRAKFIFEYLTKKGIAAERMRYKGFGNTKPKNFPELIEEDQLENRRVVIMVTGR